MQNAESGARWRGQNQFADTDRMQVDHRFPLIHKDCEEFYPQMTAWLMEGIPSAGRKVIMDNSLTQLVDEISGQALVCETVAQDLNEQSLVGESRLKGKYETEAREWLLKAGVWREAELLVRKFADPSDVIKPIAPNPLEASSNVRFQPQRNTANAL